MVSRLLLLCNKPEGVKQPFYFALDSVGHSDWAQWDGFSEFHDVWGLSREDASVGASIIWDIFPPTSASYLTETGTSSGLIARTPTCGLPACFSMCVDPGFLTTWCTIPNGECQESRVEEHGVFMTCQSSKGRQIDLAIQWEVCQGSIIEKWMT